MSAPLLKPKKQQKRKHTHDDVSEMGVGGDDDQCPIVSQEEKTHEREAVEDNVTKKMKRQKCSSDTNLVSKPEASSTIHSMESQHDTPSTCGSLPAIQNHPMSSSNDHQNTHDVTPSSSNITDASNPMYSLLVASEIQQATAPDEDGDTPLHIAVSQCEVDMVHQLLYLISVADHLVDPINNLHQTPLHIAIITKQPELVADLIQAGADPNICDRYGNTSMHLACIHKCAPIMFALLQGSKYRPQLMSKNFEGYIPLHLAVIHGDAEIVKILVHNKPNHINCTDTKNGWTALFHAAARDVEEIIEVLLQAGPDINCQSYSGNTALHIASGRGYTEVVRRLMQSGADMSMRNSHRENPAMITTNRVISNLLHGKDVRPHSPISPSRSPVKAPPLPKLTTKSQTSGWPITIINPSENIYNPFAKQNSVTPRSSPNPLPATLPINSQIVLKPGRSVSPAALHSMQLTPVSQDHIVHLLRTAQRMPTPNRSNQQSPVVGYNVTVTDEPMSSFVSHEKTIEESKNVLLQEQNQPLELLKIPSVTPSHPSTSISSRTIPEVSNISNAMKQNLIAIPSVNLVSDDARRHKSNTLLKESAANRATSRTASITDEEVSEITDNMRVQSISDVTTKVLSGATQRTNRLIPRGIGNKQNDRIVDWSEKSQTGNMEKSPTENMEYKILKRPVEQTHNIENYESSSANNTGKNVEINTLDNSHSICQNEQSLKSSSKQLISDHFEKGTALSKPERTFNNDNAYVETSMTRLKNELVDQHGKFPETGHKNIECARDKQRTGNNEVITDNYITISKSNCISSNTLAVGVIDSKSPNIENNYELSVSKGTSPNDTKIAENETMSVDVSEHLEMQDEFRRHSTEKTTKRKTLSFETDIKETGISKGVQSVSCVQQTSVEEDDICNTVLETKRREDHISSETKKDVQNLISNESESKTMSNILPSDSCNISNRDSNLLKLGKASTDSKTNEDTNHLISETQNRKRKSQTTKHYIGVGEMDKRLRTEDDPVIENQTSESKQDNTKDLTISKSANMDHGTNSVPSNVSNCEIAMEVENTDVTSPHQPVKADVSHINLKQNIATNNSTIQSHCPLSTAQALLSLGDATLKPKTSLFTSGVRCEDFLPKENITETPEGSSVVSVKYGTLDHCLSTERSKVAKYGMALPLKQTSNTLDAPADSEGQRVSVIVYSKQEVERPKSASSLEKGKPLKQVLSSAAIPRASSSSPRLTNQESTKQELPMTRQEFVLSHGLMQVVCNKNAPSVHGFGSDASSMKSGSSSSMIQTVANSRSSNEFRQPTSREPTSLASYRMLPLDSMKIVSRTVLETPMHFVNSQADLGSVYTSSSAQLPYMLSHVPHTVPGRHYIAPEHHMIARGQHVLSQVPGTIIQENHVSRGPYFITPVPPGTMPDTPHHIPPHMPQHQIIQRSAAPQFIVDEAPPRAGSILIQPPYHRLPPAITSRAKYTSSLIQPPYRGGLTPANTSSQHIGGVPINYHDPMGRSPPLLSHPAEVARHPAIPLNYTAPRVNIPPSTSMSTDSDQPMDLSCKKKPDEPLDMSIAKKTDVPSGISRTVHPSSVYMQSMSEAPKQMACMHLNSPAQLLQQQQVSDSYLMKKPALDGYESDEHRLLIDETVAAGARKRQRKGGKGKQVKLEQKK